MTDRELVAERLKFETEVLKLLVLLFVAFGGGSASLIIGDLTLVKLVLAGSGLFTILVIMIMGVRQYIKIRLIIKRAERGNP